MSELSEALEMIDMEDFLNYEGVDYRITRGQSGTQINVRECPRCGGSSWKVYLNAESGLGSCFHGSCSGLPGYNKYTFINELNEKNGSKTRDEIFRYVKDIGWQPKRIRSEMTINPPELIIPNSLALPHKGANLKYLTRRGFDGEMSGYYGWRYCSKGDFEYVDPQGKTRKQNYNKRVLIPVADIDGVVRTFQGRDVTGKADKKYLFPPGLPGSGRYLYNAHNVKGCKRLVICEGVFDVAAAKQALDEDVSLRDVGVVGSFGKTLSHGSTTQDQISVIRELKRKGLRCVTMMWDGEPSTIDAAAKTAGLIRAEGLEAFVAILPDGKDPNEAKPSEVRRAYRVAEPYSMSLVLKLKLPIHLQTSLNAR